MVTEMITMGRGVPEEKEMRMEIEIEFDTNPDLKSL